MGHEACRSLNRSLSHSANEDKSLATVRYRVLLGCCSIPLGALHSSITIFWGVGQERTLDPESSITGSSDLFEVRWTSTHGRRHRPGTRRSSQLGASDAFGRWAFSLRREQSRLQGQAPQRPNVRNNLYVTLVFAPRSILLFAMNWFQVVFAMESWLIPPF